MTKSYEYISECMITTRFWVSVAIKNMRKAGLPAELLNKAGEVTQDIDIIVFGKRSGFAKWAKEYDKG